MQVHHSAAGTLWRYRTELAMLTVATGDFLFLDRAMSLLLGCGHRGGTGRDADGCAVVAPVHTRRAWCVLSRHRIQRVFYETRMHTRSGRLPLVLRIRPTEVGERALIWCRAGICFEDFEAHTPRSPRPATPAKPASRNRSTGRSSSWSTSCAATPSPRITSSPPGWHPRCPEPAKDDPAAA